MSERLTKLYSSLIQKKERLAVGIQGAPGAGEEYSSYFDSDIKFSVFETPIMSLVTKIQTAKKVQAQLENWESAEIISRLEKIKSLLIQHRSIIAELEAHFQGTTTQFQNQWTMNSVLTILDNLLNNADKMETVSPKGLIGAITPRSQGFLEIGKRVLYSLFHKDGLVLKPARSTSVSAVIWDTILQECDLPEGLISFVYGPGTTIGKFLMDHPGVRNISFSGNHETLKSFVFSLEKKYQLYFNGKNSACILSDFDFKTRISEVARFFVEHNGKSVFSPSRILVLDSFEKDFKNVFLEYLNSIPMLTAPSQDFGFNPLRPNDKNRLTEVSAQFKKEEGRPLFQNDVFALYSDLANCSELYQEDLELPLYNVTSVKYPFDMVRWINNTSFGHSLVVFGSEEKAKKIVQKSEVGCIFYNPNPLSFAWVNPVKMSGFGETGSEIPNPFYSYIKNAH